MKLLFSLSYGLIIFLWVSNKAEACDLPDVSIVYFKLFSTQTYLPILKKDFQGGKQGGKMVIKNSYFKSLLESSNMNTNEPFFENIRMSVSFNKKTYFLNTFGQIELDKSVIGKLNKETMDHLDKGYDLYEWKTCRPMNEVLNLMLEEHKNRLEKR
ncbi:MAG: hypothetical protein WC782_03505 [Methylococcaceae bacterium]|jgi:hypothetical protein